MGDTRFDGALRRVTSASDRATAIAALSTDDLIAALAASSRASDPYLSNVLATALLNRERRQRDESTFAASLGALLSALAGVALAILALLVPFALAEPSFLAVSTLVGLLFALCVARLLLLARGRGRVRALAW